ncbi:MAG: MipA/OmpV family protein, partial [Kangiellaceae bacterium]
INEKSQKLKSSSSKNTNWEFGFGVGGLNVAHYVGAKDSRKIVLPIPYVKYQGDFLKADRQGVRGVFWNSEKAEINMSFAISLPVESKDNRARIGMPDLDFGIEFGPAFDYKIYESKNGTQSLTFKWPIRAAFELDKTSISHYGWVTSPRVTFQKNFTNWKWSSYFSLEYADKEYQSYFYDVEAAYVTNTRGFYQSKAGLLDFSVGTRLSRRDGQWFYGGFINYVDLSTAKNLESPLVKTDHNVNLGAFLIWVF